MCTSTLHTFINAECIFCSVGINKVIHLSPVLRCIQGKKSKLFLVVLECPCKPAKTFAGHRALGTSAIENLDLNAAD